MSRGTVHLCVGYMRGRGVKCASNLLQNHDGDSRPAAARVPLHRSEPHREGTDPLNGAPRPDFQRCVQDVQR